MGPWEREKTLGSGRRRVGSGKTWSSKHEYAQHEQVIVISAPGIFMIEYLADAGLSGSSDAILLGSQVVNESSPGFDQAKSKETAASRGLQEMPIGIGECLQKLLAERVN